MVLNERAIRGRRTKDGLARPHLVFQPFEVHDVGVDGDADGHDESGHTREGEGQTDGLPEVRDQGVGQGRG